MIVRALREGDRLEPPHWPLGDLWPCPDTTLVAIDHHTGKLAGVLWCAYGGPAALIGVFLSAEPRAAWMLCNAARRMASSMGCKSLLCHVKPGRLLDAYVARGGKLIEEGAHIVAFPVGGA